MQALILSSAGMRWDAPKLAWFRPSDMIFPNEGDICDTDFRQLWLPLPCFVKMKIVRAIETKIKVKPFLNYNFYNKYRVYYFVNPHQNMNV